MSSNVVYKTNPHTMFNYKFGADEESMTQCFGIIIYQSDFIFSDSPGLKERIVSVTPISDIKPA